jgi:multiple sugar transport system substrate-binding protein
MKTGGPKIRHTGARMTRRRFLAVAGAGLAAGVAVAGGARKTPARAAGPVTLTWIEWITPEISEPKMRSVLDAFEKEHPDIKIERQSMPFAPVHDKIVALAAAKQLPDILNMDSSWAPEFADEGICQPLNSYLEKEGPTFYKQFVPAHMVKYKGNYNILPLTAIPFVLYYNRKLLKQFGVDKPPDTWADDIATAQKTTKSSANLYAYSSAMALKSPYNGPYIEIFPRIYQNGGRTVDEQGKAVFNDAKGVEAFQFYLDLVNKYKVVSPGTLTNQELNKTENFAAGQNALMIDNIAHIPLFKQRSELDFGISVMVKKVRRGSVLTGWNLGMGSQTNHQAEAWAFMKWVTGPVGNRLFAEASGQLPGNTTVHGPWETDPLLRVALQQAKDPATMDEAVITPKFVERSHVLLTHIQEAISGRVSAKDALDRAKEEWDKVS